MSTIEKLEKAESYKPTQAMINNAQRGLALREKYNRGGLNSSEAKSEGVGSGVARARDIINGKLTLDTVKRMYAFFSRHEKNYRPKEKKPDGGPSAGTIAWLLWGGSAGLAWSRSILKKEGILKSYTTEITDAELNTEDKLLGQTAQVFKSFDEELKQVTYVAMKVGVDLHGDLTEAVEVRKAKENFNKSAQRANLFHMTMTDSFEVIESYLAPVDMIINEHFIEKGSWLMTLQVYDENLWGLIKSGYVNGISIGALANVEYLDEEVGNG